MSDNEFSENMVVCAVGIFSPGNISDSCESCPHNKFSFPGVLIAGVTKDAVMLLSEKVEIVPEGTKAVCDDKSCIYRSGLGCDRKWIFITEGGKCGKRMTLDKYKEYMGIKNEKKTKGANK